MQGVTTLNGFKSGNYSTLIRNASFFIESVIRSKKCGLINPLN